MTWFVVFLLFLAAVGNAALCIVAINYLYGTRFRGWWITGLRYLLQLAIIGVPAVMVGFWGHSLGQASLPWIVWSFLGLCWLIAGAVAYQTVKRWFANAPAVLQHNHTATIDVARELAATPYGSGRYHPLVRVPGNQIFQVDYNEKSLLIPRLPEAMDGITILHLSDLHFRGIPDLAYYEWVLAHCADLPADLLAITGDIMDSDKLHHWIAALGRLPWKTAAYAVLGNHDVRHDPPRIAQCLTDLGIQMLGGRTTTIQLRGCRVVICGNELPWFGPAPDLSNSPPEAFRICLTHSPDVLPWARRNRIDVLLAGHNHGGQVRIPGFGPVLVPSKFSRRYDCGVFHEPPTLMHVSRGLGATYPLRLLCRPEVTRLVLRSKTTRACA